MLILLTILAIPGHTYRTIPKIRMSDTDTSTDPELVALDNLRCSQQCASTYASPSTASTSTAPSSTSQLQTYSSKQRRLQITRHTKHTVADTALYNSTPFARQCYHIIQ